MPRNTIEPEEVERQRNAPEDDLAEDELERSAEEDAPEAVAARQQAAEDERASAPDAEALRGAVPPGTKPEDYVGGKKPHQTRTRGRTRGASGARNKVV